MKTKIYLCSLVLFTILSCKKETKNYGEVKYGIMDFVSKEHDFGIIKPGTKVNYTFKFENTGENDLIISEVKGTCGCTVPEYSKQPIKPGQDGKIKVSFDSAGKSGKVSKGVIIKANTPNGVEQLTITATIIGEGNKAASQK